MALNMSGVVVYEENSPNLFHGPKNNLINGISHSRSLDSAQFAFTTNRIDLDYLHFGPIFLYLLPAKPVLIRSQRIYFFAEINVRCVVENINLNFQISR